MTKLTIATGGILIATGVIAYFSSGAASATALIPAALGLLIGIAGLIGRNDKAHKHAIHAALAVALIGILGTLMNVVKIGDLFAGTAERPAAIIASTVTFIVLVVYLAFGIRSFIAARRFRAQRPA